MSGVQRKVDSYFIALLLEVFIVVALFMFYKGEDIHNVNFIMLCITFFIIMITYTGGMVIGLILTSAMIFLYASYIFYNNFALNVGISIMSYLWMISVPILTFTSGKLSTSISILQDTNRRLKEEYKNLVTIDEHTGLGNEKLFYRELDREISKSKRYNTPCTLMIIKLPYYREIRKIIGEDDTRKVKKDISDVIILSTRNEDERYSIENDTLAIIMSNTSSKDATVVKDRIKTGINNLNLKLREEKKYVNIDTKISILQYKDSIKNPIEFKILAEEELQYDV